MSGLMSGSFEVGSSACYTSSFFALSTSRRAVDDIPQKFQSETHVTPCSVRMQVSHKAFVGADRSVFGLRRVQGVCGGCFIYISGVLERAWGF